MTGALLFSLLALTAAAPVKARPPVAPPGSRYEQGMREYLRGDFMAALRALDAAAAEGADPAILSRIHLVRAQCFAAQQDFSRTEEAFSLALDADPEASLDPARVDPAVVRMLDGLRARLKGDLVVRSPRPGTQVLVDGIPQGTAPVRVTLPIGRHKVEGKTSDGRFAGKEEALVRVRKDTTLELTLAEVPAPPPPPAPPQKPFADLRGALAPTRLADSGIEIGGGIEWSHTRFALHARIFPDFGLTLRGAFSVPVMEELRAQVELELPVYFLGTVAVGVGGAGGAEYQASRWLGLFLQMGARYFFTGPSGYAGSMLLGQAGIRLRLP